MLSSLIKIDYKINFKKEEQTSRESGMWFSVQPLGWVLIVVSFSIGNGTIALRRILKTGKSLLFSSETLVGINLGDNLELKE